MTRVPFQHAWHFDQKCPCKVYCSLVQPRVELPSCLSESLTTLSVRSIACSTASLNRRLYCWAHSSMFKDATVRQVTQPTSLTTHGHLSPYVPTHLIVDVRVSQVCRFILARPNCLLSAIRKVWEACLPPQIFSRTFLSIRPHSHWTSEQSSLARHRPVQVRWSGHVFIRATFRLWLLFARLGSAGLQ